MRWAINFLNPIPAFFFFRVAGFMGRGGNVIVVWSSVIFFSMVTWTLASGPRPFFDAINVAIATGVLWILVVRSLNKKSAERDFAVVRGGVLCFVAFALWDNVVGKFWLPFRVEPYGFAVLLACLGHVAARRTLDRDVELGEILCELEMARCMQLSILPGAFPSSASFKVAAKYVPMTSVADDLYDFLLADDNHAGLLIADVSGHGVAAALIASMVKMAATSQRACYSSPGFDGRNELSSLRQRPQGQYVTAAYVYLDACARELHYSAAGHLAMLLLRDGAVT